MMILFQALCISIMLLENHWSPRSRILYILFLGAVEAKLLRVDCRETGVLDYIELNKNKKILKRKNPVNLL